MNTIMMTTYLAGAIMGQASFGTMDKFKTAAEEVMSQEVHGLSVICTYQHDATNERERSQEEKDKRFETVFNKFLDMIRDLRKFEQENMPEWTSKDEIPDWFFEGRPRCGGLAVEPNEWITDMDSRKLCGQS